MLYRRAASGCSAPGRNSSAMDPFEQALLSKYRKIPPYCHAGSSKLGRKFGSIQGTVKGQFPQDELLTILGQHAGPRLSSSLVFSLFIMNYAATEPWAEPVQGGLLMEFGAGARVTMLKVGYC